MLKSGPNLGKKPWEAILWSAGLALLILQDPHAGAHFSVCVFKWAGLTDCPGCGLGRAIGLLARGELAASIQMHPLGAPAALILIGRVFGSLRSRSLGATRLSLVMSHWLLNGKPQTANRKRQTANGKPQTINGKQQTANGKP